MTVVATADYSTEEVGRILGYGAQTVVKLINAGRLPATEGPQGFRIAAHDLDAFIAAMHREAGRHGSECDHSTPAISHDGDCQCVSCHCGPDHRPGGFFGACRRCGRPRVVDGRVVR